MYRALIQKRTTQSGGTTCPAAALRSAASPTADSATSSKNNILESQIASGRHKKKAHRCVRGAGQRHGERSDRAGDGQGFVNFQSGRTKRAVVCGGEKNRLWRGKNGVREINRATRGAVADGLPQRTGAGIIRGLYGDVGYDGGGVDRRKTHCERGG